MRRLINWAVAARRLFPNKRILATKLDVKAAYRQCHLNATIATQTCTQLPSQGLTLLMLRLTFGGAPCPSEWGSIAESICDLANAILLNNKWNPLSLQLPAQHLVTNNIILEDDIPFGIGRDLIVDTPVDPRGTFDLYIVNFCGLTMDIDDNTTRLKRALLLALGSAAQEVAEIEPLPCDDIKAQPQLIAEASLTEIKTFPGWLLDFHQMTIALPDNKFHPEMGMDIKRRAGNKHRMMGPPRTNRSHRPPFFSRLRFLKQRAENRRQITIDKQCK